MATQGNQTNPGGIWDGLDDFLGFLTKARDTAFDSWATYNLFSGEGFGSQSAQSAYQSENASGGAAGAWSDPRDENNRLLIWGGIALGVGALAFLVMKK